MMWRIGTLVLVGAIFGTLGAFLAERDPPTTVHSAELLTPLVRPGGELRIRYNVYRRRSCETVVERMLYDSERVRHILVDLEFKGSPGPLGPDSYVSIIGVPRNFARGEARYRALTTYRCNLVHGLWPITVLTADVSFDVAGGVLDSQVGPAGPQGPIGETGPTGPQGSPGR